jgi:hypothetical protein
VLKLGLAAAVALAPQALAAKPKGPVKPENVLSPDAALDRLMQGNARYVEGVSRRHDFKHEREPLSTGQNPFAAVLSCADSRIAPEYCFDTARGDVFVCRVAGNFASDVVIASLEYAVQVLNTPFIMVLGQDPAVRSTRRSNRSRRASRFRPPAGARDGACSASPRRATRQRPPGERHTPQRDAQCREA